MIGVMAFMVFAMMIVGLLLMAIAGCVIELICSREEAQEIKEEMRHKERADCPAKIAYDYIDERNARIYYTEVRHLHENFRSSYLRRMCMDIKGGRARGKV